MRRSWGSSTAGLPDVKTKHGSRELMYVFNGYVTSALNDPPDYVALTYIWSNTQNLMLTAPTAASLQTPGIITADNPNIPLTIRDAILAYQLLSLQYL